MSVGNPVSVHAARPGGAIFARSGAGAGWPRPSVAGLAEMLCFVVCALPTASGFGASQGASAWSSDSWKHRGVRALGTCDLPVRAGQVQSQAIRAVLIGAASV